MAVASGQVSVTSGGKQVVPPANATWNGSYDVEPPGRYVVISNGSGAAVFLGGSGVTTLTGLSLAASTSVGFWLHPDEAVYGIVASTGTTVSYLESGS